MAKLEIQWVKFLTPTRISSAQGDVSAMAADGGTRLFLGHIEGLAVVVVEAPGLPFPATVPWANVSGVGWLTPPPIVYADVPEPAKPIAKGKPAKLEVEA